MHIKNVARWRNFQKERTYMYNIGNNLFWLILIIEVQAAVTYEKQYGTPKSVSIKPIVLILFTPCCIMYMYIPTI